MSRRKEKIGLLAFSLLVMVFIVLSVMPTAAAALRRE